MIRFLSFFDIDFPQVPISPKHSVLELLFVTSCIYDDEAICDDGDDPFLFVKLHHFDHSI